MLLEISLVTALMSGYSNVETELEHECLARTVYHEARGEPYLGQVAAAYSVITRTKIRHLNAKSWCETVKYPRQYEWAGDYDNLPKMNKKDKLRAYQVVYSIIYGGEKDPTDGAIYFYNPQKVKSKFHENRKFLVKLGNHVFSK